MMRFSKEAYYGIDCVDTKTCDPWVLAYDKHEVIENEFGGYEVIPHPDEVGKGYFQTKAYVHRHWLIDDESKLTEEE